MSSDPHGPQRLGRDFLRVTIGNFFFFLTFASFFLLPLHIRELGGSERTVGFLMGTTGVSGLVSVFVVGRLLDRWGRIFFLRLGTIVMGLATLGFLWPTSIGPALFVLRIVQGLAFSCSFNAAATLAADLAPVSRRTSALGLFGISTLLTHAIAPTLGEQLIAAGGFPLLFVVASGFCVIALAVTWTLPAPPVRPRNVAAPPLRAIHGFAPAIAAIGCCGVAFGTTLTFMPTFVRDEGLGLVSGFYVAYTVSAVGVRMIGGGLADRIGARVVLLPAMFGLAIAVASLAAVHSVGALVGVGLMFGLAHGFIYPTMNAYTVGLVDPSQLGEAQSFFNGAFNLGTTFGSLLFGNVVHAYGHRVMFVGCGSVVLLALAIFGLAGQERGQQRLAPSTYPKRPV